MTHDAVCALGCLRMGGSRTVERRDERREAETERENKGNRRGGWRSASEAVSPFFLCSFLQPAFPNLSHPFPSCPLNWLSSAAP